VSTTATETTTFLVSTKYGDYGSTPEFVDAPDGEQAVATLQEMFDRDPEFSGWTATDAEPLQAVLDALIAKREAGVNLSLSFKHESGSSGPVWVTDLDAMQAEAEKQDAIREDGTIVLGVPFGTTPDYETRLPWMRKSEAKRLAKYLAIPYGES
jgi:hypothetical protein